MTAGIDATPLVLSSGGLKTYTAELSRALAAEFPDDVFRLVTDQRVRWKGERPPNLELDAHRPKNVWDKRWWLCGIQRALRGVHVFHGTNFAVPYLPLRPAVITIHDLSPWHDPSWHQDAGRVRRRTPLLLRLGLATMVITPTEAIRRDCISRFLLHPSRVVAIHEAPSQRCSEARAGSGGAPYFLFVGTIEPRKNIATIIEAWRCFYKTHGVRLLLAGRRRSDAPVIAGEEGLDILGEVPDEQLPGLYAGAAATLYPSLYEGFGLPVLEAMQHGSPVICSRDPALLEVSGGAAIHIEATDTRGWADAMRSILTSEDRRRDRSELSRKRAAGFSWAQTARATYEVYQEAIRRHGA